MKRLREMFRLTNAEQRVIVIVLLALLAFAILQRQRARVAPNLPKQSLAPAATSSPADTD